MNSFEYSRRIEMSAEFMNILDLILEVEKSGAYKAPSNLDDAS